LSSQPIYTTVSRYVAKLGYSFKFLGASEPCQSCSMLKVCLGRLEEDELYSIIKVGKNRLECSLIGEDAVVVQVKSSSRVLAVSNRSAVVGTTLRVQAREGVPCGDQCLCLPDSVKLKRKYVVRRIVKKAFDCPLASSRSLVEVEPV
jgi:uncharacterized protein (UPF0179 family)